MRKTPRDISILQMCTTNDNHMVMVLEMWNPMDRMFCPFTPEKSKFWKYEKNTWRYNFTQVYQIS